VAVGGKRRCEIRRQSRLADAALAGGDADDVLDRGQGALRKTAGTAESLLEVGLLRIGQDVEADAHLGDAVEREVKARRREVEKAVKQNRTKVEKAVKQNRTKAEAQLKKAQKTVSERVPALS
jgi:hypothetical protein